MAYPVSIYSVLSTVCF